MNEKATTQRNSRPKRGGHYKLVFKPANYTGNMARFNHAADDDKPLITWKNIASLQRCYRLVEQYDFLLADIYDTRQPRNSPPVARYTAAKAWNNPV